MEAVMKKAPVLMSLLALAAAGLPAPPRLTVADALKNIRVLAIPRNGRPVDRTVAEDFRRHLAPAAAIEERADGTAPVRGLFRIGVAGEGLVSGP